MGEVHGRREPAELICATHLYSNGALGPVAMGGMFYGEGIERVAPSAGRWSSAVHSF